jgi:hypothetical protein
VQFFYTRRPIVACTRTHECGFKEDDMSTKPLPPEFGGEKPLNEEKESRTLTRRDFVKIAGVAGAAAGAGILSSGLVQKAEAAGPSPKPPVTTPTLTCIPNGTDGAAVIDVTVCAPAGGTGLPAGFSVQWMTCAEFEVNGNAWYASDDPRLCKASFSGNASGTNYNLAAGACLTVHAGNFLIDNQQGYSSSCEDPLDCNTCYVFHAFGHATSKLNRSADSLNCQSTTDACPPVGFVGCTRSKGFFGQQGITDGSTQCALNYYCTTLGTCVTVGGQTFSTAAQVDAVMPGGSGAAAFGNINQQRLALALNIALSAAGCADLCTDSTGATPFPSGFGSAVVCEIVDGVTPLGGTGFFPTGSAAQLNGQTVQQIYNAGGYSSLTASQYAQLEEELNTSFDGDPCCGTSSFGLNHLFVGSCPP